MARYRLISEEREVFLLGNNSAGNGQIVQIKEEGQSIILGTGKAVDGDAVAVDVNTGEVFIMTAQELADSWMLV